MFVEAGGAVIAGSDSDLLVPGPDGPPDIGPVLDRLCADLITELGLLGAVVTLMTARGDQAVAGASDASSRRLEELQYGVGEGPARDAFAAGRPVLVPDLEKAFVRWPGFVPVALRAGAGATYTFPLKVGETRFGVLSCYSGPARELSHLEVGRCALVAGLATEVVLDRSERGFDDPGEPAELNGALHLRNEIYQAQGMLMVQLGVTLVEALARMRAYAFAADADLTVVAGGILDGRIILPHDDR